MFFANYSVDVPFFRRLEIEIAIEDKKDSHGFIFHVSEVRQKLWRYEEILTRVVCFARSRFSGRIRDDSSKHKSFIAIATEREEKQ